MRCPSHAWDDYVNREEAAAEAACTGNRLSVGLEPYDDETDGDCRPEMPCWNTCPLRRKERAGN